MARPDYRLAKNFGISYFDLMQSLSRYMYIVFFLIALLSCKSVRNIYLGNDTSLFDSSKVSLKRVKRLAFVDFLQYKTIDHRAGKMDSKSRIASWGIFSTQRISRNYNWDGELIFTDDIDTSVVNYTAVIGQEDKGDYAMFSIGNLLNEKRTPTSDRTLTVEGIILLPNDSAAFMFYNSDANYSQVLDGYVLFHNEKWNFKKIDTSYNKQKLLQYKPYGYKLFVGESMLAGIDVVSNPPLVYVNKAIDKIKRKIIAGYISIVIGNLKIVTRKSIFFQL